MNIGHFWWGNDVVRNFLADVIFPVRIRIKAKKLFSHWDGVLAHKKGLK
jgi:hypothetical protein